jgi:hypothetical protein
MIRLIPPEKRNNVSANVNKKTDGIFKLVLWTTQDSVLKHKGSSSNTHKER